MRTVIGVVVCLAAGCGDVQKIPDSGTDIDASAGDAAALPTAPPVTNGQFADLAIGVPDLVTRTSGTTADTSQSAGGLCTAASHLWISDLSNARVLQLNAPPLVFSADADLAIGQKTLTAEAPGPTDILLTPPEVFYDNSGDVGCDGTRVVVADTAANRVLIWNAVPSASGAPFNVVLGQTTTTGGAAGTSASMLSSPRGVWTDGTRLIVADSGNHRVLIWSSLPTTNGAPADVVLGQASFNVAAAPQPPTPSSMNNPVDVFFDGERLYVSDSDNNRVMGWNGMPTQNNQPAEFFVGQNGGSTGGPNASAGSQEPNAIGLHLPTQITVAHGSLYIIDTVNFRAVVHTPRPTTSGEPADAVLGDSDFVGTKVTDSQTLTPRGLVVLGDKLWLSDSNLATGGSRVLRYSLTNLP
ncbi:MAG: hypothetical protein WKG01_18565 [Kofleriaceae bacterium]